MGQLFSPGWDSLGTSPIDSDSEGYDAFIKRLSIHLDASKHIHDLSVHCIFVIIHDFKKTEEFTSIIFYSSNIRNK